MRTSRCALLAALVVICLGIWTSGCKDTGGSAALAPAGPEAGGELQGHRYFNANYGLYWFKPAGMKPMDRSGDQDFLFGWQDKRGSVKAMVWVAPGNGNADLGGLASEMAQAKGWKLSAVRLVSWQGQRALDGAYQAGDRAGLLRLLAGPDAVVIAAADAPSGWAVKNTARLAAVLERLRLVPPGDVLHTVKSKRETLNTVALWYTGLGKNWVKIKKYNKLKAEHLSPNQQILIPKDLVWRLDPMPGWANRLAAKKRPSKAKKTEPAEEAPDQDLLPTGPK